MTFTQLCPSKPWPQFLHPCHRVLHHCLQTLLAKTEENEHRGLYINLNTFVVTSYLKSFRSLGFQWLLNRVCQYDLGLASLRQLSHIFFIGPDGEALHTGKVSWGPSFCEDQQMGLSLIAKHLSYLSWSWATWNWELKASITICTSGFDGWRARNSSIWMSEWMHQ